MAGRPRRVGLAHEHHSASDHRRHRPLRSRAVALLCATLGLAAIAASPAAAAPDVDGKFTVSGVGTDNDIAKGPDGNMWVTLDQTNDVAKITPRGVVTEFNPANVTSPVGITAGPDGNIWVTQAGGVARFSPNQPRRRGQVRHRRRQRPAPDRHRPRRQPMDHQRRERDPDPAADPTTATSFPVLVAGRDIDASRDGRLWVADFASQVVRVTTAGVAKAFSTGDGSGLQSIAAGPKSQVAYADPTSQPQKIGRVSSSGQIQKTNTRATPSASRSATTRLLVPALRHRRPGASDARRRPLAPGRPGSELGSAADRHRPEPHPLGDARPGRKGRPGHRR